MLPLNNLGLVYGPDDTLRGWLYRCAQPMDPDSFKILDTLAAASPVIIRVSESGEGGITLEQETEFAAPMEVSYLPVGYPFATALQAHNVADEIERHIAAGRDVFVHCKRGHDRTRFAVVSWQLKYDHATINYALAQSAPYFDLVDHIFDAQMTDVLRGFAESLRTGTQWAPVLKPDL